tara:strand:+ start:1802 stop:2005 length:204 start_codon:yes stop_codon:yes gene_type:complete
MLVVLVHLARVKVHSSRSCEALCSGAFEKERPSCVSGGSVMVKGPMDGHIDEEEVSGRLRVLTKVIE